MKIPVLKQYVSTCTFILLTITLTGSAIYADQHVGVKCRDLRHVYNWWSVSREDNFATTDDRWAAPVGIERSGYKMFRVEGLVFKEQQPETIPLYSWYSDSRGDNFITSDSRWTGRPGDKKDGYRFVRIEGYIHDPELARPDNQYLTTLYSFWSPSREDNFATSDPRWAGNIGDKKSGPDYTLFRNEGYLYKVCES